MRDPKDREDESVHSEEKGSAKVQNQSWKDRHGATLVAVGAAVLLVVLIAFQTNC